ncbi:hypothetical protein F5887DRAFT_1083123 [Amanita rubescens]|nr:hypothetical protein F5887DRAFT_1083123 [Amanita rubescens]
MFNSLKRLFGTVSWSGKLKSPYKNDPTRKAQIEQKVKEHAEKKNLTDRGAVAAVIESTEHTGGSNPNQGNHVTTSFKDANGNHVTTHHVMV